MADDLNTSLSGNGPRDRTLRRLLRKPELERYVLPLLEQAFPPRAVTDLEGEILAGRAEARDGQSARIQVGDEVIGYAWGDRAGDIARAFGALAVQDREIRALGRESLAKYREITMLYALAEKIIGAPDPTRIATIVCEQALRFLHCDSAALMLLSAETGRLEIVANQGAPFHSRATRELGSDVIADVLTSGVGEIVNDVAADSRTLAADNHLSSVVLSALRTNDKTFGVLVAGSEKERHFNASDLQVLNAIGAHAAAAIEVDRLNRDLAETVRKPPDLIYGVNEVPPPGVCLLLAAQHAFLAILSLAYPILIVQEAGGDRAMAAAAVSMTLIAMAVGTVAQSMGSGIVGSGQFAPYVSSGIYIAPALQAARMGGIGMVMTMTMLSGLFSLLLSRFLRRYRWLFPPEVSGVVVMMVGLSIVPVALPRFLGLGSGDEVTTAPEIVVGVFTLGMIVLLSIAPFGRIRLYSTAVGFVLGYALAAFLGLFDATILSAVGDLPLVGLSLVSYERLSFDVALLLPFAVATVASNISDAGLIISSQKTNNAGWTRADTRSLSGGIVATGVSNVVSGALGGAGTNLSGGNISLAAATGATSRRIGLYLAGIFLFMALVPKLTALLALVPSPVLGAGLLYLASHLISSGVSLIASRMLDARRNFVVGIPLLAGVGLIAYSDMLVDAPAWLGMLASSPLALATLLALGLNILLNAGVANHATTRLTLDENLSEHVTRFVSRQGASWGARGEVVRRAAPAITEWCEELHQTLGSDKAALDLHFDDFRLTATIRDPKDPEPRPREIDTEQAAIDRTARAIARRYGCGVRLNTVREIVFDFEH
ncbi:GAF domain-containing protein [Halovulum dunhuangense]|uniref:GAF domain-containing protein n=1 Tax=Halovulum dunhuangense TaxID=1505036 RepID=A0A849L1H4_9RHOB|nr:solute carrier family 23 protein [Halovulum dunhuangense]NNU80136.1 GAF domain-containing protein [Halovulum dunhuangense]